ncbi:MAG: oligosaccharide flippase family protein [Rubrivivax sp.]|nr:oligosaccharide flippase family protein [Rubrivivax sp.]
MWRPGPDGSRFARNVGRVAGANVLAQGLLLASAPLLTRLYRPEDFGALGVFMALVSLGMAFATARLEWSLPNPRSPTQAAALLACGLAVLGGVCALIATALPWAPQALLPADWRGLSGTLWLLPWVLAGQGLVQLLQAWHVRGAELGPLSRVKLLQSAAQVAVALLAALSLGAAAGVWGLLAGALAGAWAGAIGLGLLASGLGPAWRRLSRLRIAAAWRRYRGQAGWSTLAAVLNTLSLTAVPLLLARHYGAAEVGYYALMQRVAFGPIGLVGSAVRQSFWAEAAQQARRDPATLRALFLRSTRRLGLLAIPVAALALAGPWIVGPLFGAAQWQGAGWVLAASVPMLLGQMVVSPLSHLEVHGRQRGQAAWDGARLFLLIAAVEWQGRTEAPLAQTVLCLSSVLGLMYLVLYRMNLRALDRAATLRP